MQNLSTSFSSFYSGRLSQILTQSGRFLWRVYRTGKTTELLSFIGWEFLYKIKYYGPVKTISLSDRPPLTIDAAGKLMYASASNAKQPYRVEASRIDWKYRFTDSQGEVWGCEFRQNTKLLRVQDGQTPQTVWTFPVAIRSMHVTNEAIFVCAGGILYRSPKVTTTFEPCFS
ncbi:MAG: hypothetical protein EAZ91_17155 [Cytophagales bacterium]|nr:MAG: hypothetical protein EAZ91_17155 [Cytophagales bacterium]